jgi:hypothetical protein
MAEMKEHPILFNGDMVRAILDGRKTQTRRVVKLPLYVYLSARVHGDGPFSYINACKGEHEAKLNQFGAVSVRADGGEWLGVKPGEFVWQCPYGKPGDPLWVRETMLSLTHEHHMKNGQLRWPKPKDDRGIQTFRDNVIYAADVQYGDTILSECYGTYNKSHMPRWASRITLEIADIRVERVQEISHDDAVAEGCYRIESCDKYPHGNAWGRAGFAILWDSINAKRGFGWNINPWVWVIEFKQVNNG